MLKGINIQQIPKERLEIIMGRYKAFQACADNVEIDPVNVFDPLKPEVLKDLELIREVSVSLQKKKDEDMMKQKALQEEMLAARSKTETSA